jgi:hypothetical protein
MNVLHPAQVTPSWNGDAVGRYEGDELVIDTVGVKIGPFAMVDEYGTPHTEALHVVERYRLLEYEAAKEFWERNAKANFRIPDSDIGPEVDTAYTGKVLQLQFTVEDEGVFTTPWRRPSLIGAGWTNSANLSVRRTLMNIMPERTVRFRPRPIRISE